jgi:hypothetical protein
MKTTKILTALFLAASLPATAALFSYTYDSGFVNGTSIPDGNANPWSDTRTVAVGESGLLISEVRVRLNLSGGYNGDLYGYLSYNGVLVPLMNRVGVGSSDPFGYGDGGLNVTFQDGAANNIHFYQSVGGYSITGGASWQPDGRTVDPIAGVPADFDLPGTVTLGNFSAMDPNGDWTLVFADVVGGGGSPTVASWGLDIEAVPEPVNVALGVFGAGALLAWAGSAWKKWRPA